MPDVAFWIWSPLMIDGAEQVGVLVVLRAGHQRQGRVVVAGQDVFLVAPGGLVLQGEELHALAGALPPLLFLGDALGEVLARVRRARAHRPAAHPPAAARPAAARPAAALRSRAGRGWAPGSAPGWGPPDRAVAAGRAGRPAGAARAGPPAPARADPPVRHRARGRRGPAGGAGRLLGLGLGLLRVLRRNRLDHRADVQPRGLAEVAGFVAVVSGHRDDQVVAVDDDLRTRDAQPVDAGADDLLRLCQRVAAGP